MHGGASPVARRTAARLGIDLPAAGSGPRGRVVKADVLAAVAAAPAAGRAASAAAAAPAPPAPAAALAVDLVVAVDIDMSAALELCDRLAPLADPAPGALELTVKAAALALRDALGAGIHVGVEGAAVRDADRKSLAAIAADVRGTAGVDDVALGVSLLPVDRSAVAGPVPQLSLGAVRDAPACVDGAVVVRPLMTATLACDRRALAAADAAAFLERLRRLLEAPLALAL